MISENLGNFLLAGLWVCIQAGILYYQWQAASITRRVLRGLRSDRSEIYRVARERYLSQIYRFVAIFGYFVVGMIVAFQIRDLRLLIGPLLLLGEFVLFRNTRADVRLIHDLARTRAAAAPKRDDDDPSNEPTISPLASR